MLQTEKREGAKVCLLLEFDFFRLRKFQLPVVQFVARKCFFFFFRTWVEVLIGLEIQARVSILHQVPYYHSIDKKNSWSKIRKCKKGFRTYEFLTKNLKNIAIALYLLFHTSNDSKMPSTAKSTQNSFKIFFSVQIKLNRQDDS